MLLIRVYYQAAIAAQIGINNLAALPDLRIFKQTYHVTTLNNKLGLAEKKQCQKMLQGIYHCSDNFFKEIDFSIKKKCRSIQDVQPYLLQFQGFMLGIGGVLTYKNSNLSKVLTTVPLERIVLETDAPYLSPVPYRGKRNESAYITEVLQKVADIYNVSRQETESITNNNAKHVFRRMTER